MCITAMATHCMQGLVKEMVAADIELLRKDPTAWDPNYVGRQLQTDLQLTLGNNSRKIMSVN